MDRVIKFRAWDKEDEKLYKVVSLSEGIWGDCEQRHIKICDFDKSPLNYETDVRLSFDYELMQFTGLTDRNGKEIYEGDIFVGEYGRQNEMLNYFVVRMIDGCWGAVICHDYPIEGDGFYWKEVIEFKEAEVIGNIYENSDLLATT